jgi:predicted GH43/DUF377 family glycosyl hydrolase
MQIHYQQFIFSTLVILLISCTNGKSSDKIEDSFEFKPVTYSFQELEGIGFEKGITRRDPSDVIDVDGIYYVYYTKVIGRAPGYWGDIWVASSNDKGYTWKEERQVVGLGQKGTFDSQAVFTPNIIRSNGKYYLFYTGVKPTPGRSDGEFENNSTTDITALGLAVSDNPTGPFERHSTEPILEVSEDPEKFDSFRIDDASLLFKEGKYLLYYKGRSRSHNESGPSHTQMGVAFANKPEGPYKKHPNPLLDKSHEVLIWKQGSGVAALASISSTLEYSETGFDFTSDRKSIKVSKRPNAPGAFRADLTGGDSYKLKWGISMVHNKTDCYLVRYDVNEIESNIEQKTSFDKGSFGYDKEFLQKYYKNTIVLQSDDKKSGVVLSPELQGRIMTSSLNGDFGLSFGWINYDLIQSKEIQEHINVTGGEERFWLGPEGGQFSIYFKEGSEFVFDNWYVPASLDTQPFNTISKNSKSAMFQKEMSLTNYSGTVFNLDITRKISLLSKDEIKKSLQIGSDEFSSVAYETQNIVKNIGKENWQREKGLLSIWLLSMLNPSPEVTVVAPIKEGPLSELGIKVNDNYFGKVSADRLKTTEKNVFFKADGASRGKIGLGPKRSTKYIGSYDAKNAVLTILEIREPNSSDRYVNSAWELQKDPYSGDVFNSYNDGKLEDGSQLGPFYELESSSPALELKSGESYAHTQRIYHFKGKKEIIDQISKKILKVTTDEIKAAF